MVARAGQNRDLWLLDLIRGNLTRFTFDPGQDGFCVWSLDGMRIVFTITPITLILNWKPQTK